MRRRDDIPTVLEQVMERLRVLRERFAQRGDLRPPIETVRPPRPEPGPWTPAQNRTLRESLRRFRRYE